MESVSRFIEKKLRLQVNREKSAVGRPWERKYLGFCLTNSRKNPKIRIHWKTIKRFKQRVREITARRRGRSLSQVIDELNQFMQRMVELLRLDRIVQPPTSIASLDQTSTSGVNLEALEKPQNPCAVNS